MTKPRIIVTGATGKTGNVVATELLRAGYPVRALVHREDSRSTRLKEQGAEIAVADLSDVERVADALKGVQRAYFCPPDRFPGLWMIRWTRVRAHRPVH
ncbi:MAG: NmrA family NAD(P)-binding protein [Terriglobales bacterium]